MAASPTYIQALPEILSAFLNVRIAVRSTHALGGSLAEEVNGVGHSDGDPDKTKEEYDNDNHSDQLNPNNDEYDQ